MGLRPGRSSNSISWCCGHPACSNMSVSPDGRFAAIRRWIPSPGLPDAQAGTLPWTFSRVSKFAMWTGKGTAAGCGRPPAQPGRSPQPMAATWLSSMARSIAMPGRREGDRSCRTAERAHRPHTIWGLGEEALTIEVLARSRGYVLSRNRYAGTPYWFHQKPAQGPFPRAELRPPAIAVQSA